MKWLHRLIVTSETYRRASSGPAERESANSRIDPDNRLLWKFPLRRLEAEPIRDALLVVAGRLDLSVGGKSFEDGKAGSNRRAAYMARGYLAYTNAMPDFLQTFDAEDGRMTCPRRNQTVTAPQALFMMNNELVEDASSRFAERLKKEAGGDVTTAVTLGFRIALGRSPSDAERAKALEYVPAHAVAVAEPATGVRLAAALEQRVPVAIELRLVLAGDHEGDGVVERIVRAGAHRLDRPRRPLGRRRPDASDPVASAFRSARPVGHFSVHVRRGQPYRHLRSEGKQMGRQADRRRRVRRQPGRDEAPGDSVPSHLHALREIGHPGFRLVPGGWKCDRRHRRGALDVVPRDESFSGSDRNGDRPSGPGH